MAARTWEASCLIKRLAMRMRERAGPETTGNIVIDDAVAWRFASAVASLVPLPRPRSEMSDLEWLAHFTATVRQLLLIAGVEGNPGPAKRSAAAAAAAAPTTTPATKAPATRRRAATAPPKRTTGPAPATSDGKKKKDYVPSVDVRTVSLNTVKEGVPMPLVSLMNKLAAHFTNMMSLSLHVIKNIVAFKLSETGSVPFIKPTKKATDASSAEKPAGANSTVAKENAALSDKQHAGNEGGDDFADGDPVAASDHDDDGGAEDVSANKNEPANADGAAASKEPEQPKDPKRINMESLCYAAFISCTPGLSDHDRDTNVRKCLLHAKIIAEEKADLDTEQQNLVDSLKLIVPTGEAHRPAVVDASVRAFNWSPVASSAKNKLMRDITGVAKLLLKGIGNFFDVFEDDTAQFDDEANNKNSDATASKCSASSDSDDDSDDDAEDDSDEDEEEADPKRVDFEKQFTDPALAPTRTGMAKLLADFIGLEPGMTIDIKSDSWLDTNCFALIAASMKLAALRDRFNEQQLLRANNGNRPQLIKKWSTMPKVDGAKTQMMPLRWGAVYSLCDVFDRFYPAAAAAFGVAIDRSSGIVINRGEVVKRFITRMFARLVNTASGTQETFIGGCDVTRLMKWILPAAAAKTTTATAAAAPQPPKPQPEPSSSSSAAAASAAAAASSATTTAVAVAQDSTPTASAPPATAPKPASNSTTTTKNKGGRPPDPPELKREKAAEDAEWKKRKDTELLCSNGIFATFNATKSQLAVKLHDIHAAAFVIQKQDIGKNTLVTNLTAATFVSARLKSGDEVITEVEAARRVQVAQQIELARQIELDARHGNVFSSVRGYKLQKAKKEREAALFAIFCETIRQGGIRVIVTCDPGSALADFELLYFPAEQKLGPEDRLSCYLRIISESQQRQRRFHAFLDKLAIEEKNATAEKKREIEKRRKNAIADMKRGTAVQGVFRRYIDIAAFRPQSQRTTFEQHASNVTKALNNNPSSSPEPSASMAQLANLAASEALPGARKSLFRKEFAISIAEITSMENNAIHASNNALDAVDIVNKMNSKSHWDRFVNELLRNPFADPYDSKQKYFNRDEVGIFFGAWYQRQGQRGFGGRSSFPVQQVKTFLRGRFPYLFEIDEYFTSKKCLDCGTMTKDGRAFIIAEIADQVALLRANTTVGAAEQAERLNGTLAFMQQIDADLAGSSSNVKWNGQGSPADWLKGLFNTPPEFFEALRAAQRIWDTDVRVNLFGMKPRFHCDPKNVEGDLSCMFGVINDRRKKSAPTTASAAAAPAPKRVSPKKLSFYEHCCDKFEGKLRVRPVESIAAGTTPQSQVALATYHRACAAVYEAVPEQRNDFLRHESASSVRSVMDKAAERLVNRVKFTCRRQGCGRPTERSGDACSWSCAKLADSAPAQQRQPLPQQQLQQQRQPPPQQQRQPPPQQQRQPPPPQQQQHFQWTASSSDFWNKEITRQQLELRKREEARGLRECGCCRRIYHMMSWSFFCSSRCRESYDDRCNYRACLGCDGANKTTNDDYCNERCRRRALSWLCNDNDDQQQDHAPATTASAAAAASATSSAVARNVVHQCKRPGCKEPVEIPGDFCSFGCANAEAPHDDSSSMAPQPIPAVNTASAAAAASSSSGAQAVSSAPTLAPARRRRQGDNQQAAADTNAGPVAPAAPAASKRGQRKQPQQQQAPSNKPKEGEDLSDGLNLIVEHGNTFFERAEFRRQERIARRRARLEKRAQQLEERRHQNVRSYEQDLKRLRKQFRRQQLLEERQQRQQPPQMHALPRDFYERMKETAGIAESAEACAQRPKNQKDRVEAQQQYWQQQQPNHQHATAAPLPGDATPQLQYPLQCSNPMCKKTTGALVRCGYKSFCTECVNDELRRQENELKKPRRTRLSGRDRAVHYAKGDTKRESLTGAVVDLLARMMRRLTLRCEPIAGAVREFFYTYYSPQKYRPEPEPLDQAKIDIRRMLTWKERRRYRKKRAEKRAAWRRSHEGEQLLWRVRQCNTCGAVRHRDQHSCDNMMLFVLYAIVAGSLRSRPPYLERINAAERAAVAADAAQAQNNNNNKN